MKTAHISTPTHEIMLVENEEATMDNLTEFTGETEGYEILGFVSDLKESEVEALVEISFDTPRMYRDYKHNLPGLTALESLLSLLETKVMWENPFPKPDDEEIEWFKKQIYGDFSERYTPIFEWYDAQSRTFDKARTIVLVKERQQYL